MTQTTIQLKAETLTALSGVFGLLEALVAAEPKLEPLMAQGTRVVYDIRDGLLIVSALQPDGQGVPVAAINAQPMDPECGTVGLPVAMPEPKVWH
jgi:hypothetical protein